MITTQVDMSELNSLDRRLGDIASNTDSVAAKAQSVGIGNWEMYGLFVSPVACAILATADAFHAGAFKGLAEVSAGVSQNLSATAQAYEETESTNAANATTISQGL